MCWKVRHMPKNREFYDWRGRVWEGGGISTKTLTNGIELSGYVATVHGYVMVKSMMADYPNGEKFLATTLDFIHGGSMHSRRYSEYFRPRTLAKAFAEDVVSREANAS